MAVDDKIRDEKLQCSLNGKAATISILSSGKIDKYECLTGEETYIFYSAKFTYSTQGKAFGKQT